jgi:surface protein
MNGWDVSKVTDMYEAFGYTTNFNQPISAWDVSSVANMAYMFYQAAAFNQPIGSWVVSKVTTMEGMFGFATSFQQPLGSWDVSHVTTMASIFSSVTLSMANYNDLLTGWATLAVQSSVTLDAGSSKYSTGAPATGKQHLVTMHSWTINDGGQV